jgi:hypothetical protein
MAKLIFAENTFQGYLIADWKEQLEEKKETSPLT